MRIDIYADIACPWCYIGERRLVQALAQRPALAAELHWRPFQLQPDLPPTGVPWQEFAPQKFGSAEQARAMFWQVARAGAPDGIDFKFAQVATAANTRDAHRMLLYAADHGGEWPLAEALFKAYFTDGRDLNNLDHLIAIAAEVGIAAADVRALLASDAYRAEVDESQSLAARLGIQGVPFYVIDERCGMSGAQPVATFLQMLDQIAGENADA